MQKGFTLMEIMVVVAIVGILMAIVIPAYQTYIIRTKVNNALQEIVSSKTSYELLVNQDYRGVINSAPLDLQAITQQCQISIHLPDTAGFAKKAIRCQLYAIDRIEHNAEIYLTRDNVGIYSCHTENLAKKFIPTICS